MRTIEIENDGNVVLGEVVMVTPVIKAIRVVFVIEGIIKFQLCIFSVHVFGKFVQFGA